MPLPKMPWYDKLEKAVAPTEGAANLLLVIIIVACLVVLLFGKPIHKAALVVYLVSP